ncbi:MAG: RIP metalloprotease RseP [Puniceicoccales bacterium]|jgi:RIP metalloprotease RseP|nr:RIP metalloprotease RseP [Puniceicoccales bacterium]
MIFCVFFEAFYVFKTRIFGCEKYRHFLVYSTSQMNLLQVFCPSLESLDFKAIFLVIIFFGGSIFVHELGHFLAAKRRKLFVPRFSIGFGPRIFSKTIGETEFCLSFLPLGGYVALPQLMDMKAIEGKYTIPETAKPISTGDKIIVSAMGAIFNIIFAFVLATVLWPMGIQCRQGMTNNVVGYVSEEIRLSEGTKVPSPAKVAGIQIGDEIIAIDGHEVHDFNDIIHGIALGKKRDQQGPLSVISILRDGKRQDLTVHPVLVEQNQRSKESLRIIGVQTSQELVISEVYKHSPAEQVGLQIDDKLHSVNGIPIRSYFQFDDILKNSSDIQLTVERSGEPVTVALKSQLLPLTQPHVKLTTTDGVLEIFPSFGKRNSLEDPCKDACELRILSLSPEFQKKYPELHIGSLITSIDGQAISNFSDTLFICQNKIETPIEVTIDGIRPDLVIKKVKFIPPENYHSFGVELRETDVLCHKNPLEQISKSAHLIFSTLDSLISPSSDVHLKNLMGPPGIIKTLNTFATEDFRLLLSFIIILNVNLAILNLLPLPILDGGIIALVLLELLLRRKIATQILVSIQCIFMILLLSFMLYVSFFDVNRILGEKIEEERYQKWQCLIIDEQLLWNGLKSHFTSHPN